MADPRKISSLADIFLVQEDANHFLSEWRNNIYDHILCEIQKTIASKAIFHHISELANARKFHGLHSNSRQFKRLAGLERELEALLYQLK